MFTESDFEIFDDPTLSGRMAGIRARIDPKFEALAPKVIKGLSLAQAIYPHIAKHLRRHKNPPMNTWIAFSTNPRGYKMMPHLMIGFWDDRLFVWLATLAEAKERQKMIARWEALLPKLTELSGNYQISPNHTAKSYRDLTPAGLIAQLNHYRRVQQADFMVGKQWFRGDNIFLQPAQVQSELLRVSIELRPIFAELIK
ncbi:DUF1054 family protein [Secundilactobacillus folii]|uniref:DUF1054 family protein n=1 Tax=Secundilactobacillus folii TaxID=2678357 RepID=UPI0012D422F1|nr:DUF1054 family protein [Secundilactobacillus folii]